ncbi:MAG: DNA mismatch repair endonuclease MutL [Methylocystaceae bacterium]
MAIRVLEDHLINQIAAGEVVERPASVVKELLENSLDAGASNIEVEIEEGGQGLIRVIDNGCGIPASEMELAFTRHATSKLNNESDLVAILTLGFRGEALPSIASVAKVKMVSSTDGQQGYGMQLAGGEIMTRGVQASPPGTMIEISDLFYNTPARLKFLKSKVTEALQVQNIVFKLALSHPEVSLSYRQNGRLLFKTPGMNSLIDAVNAVKGTGYADGFLTVNLEAEYRVWGLISKIDFKRKNRREEIFLVNHRPVHSPLLMRALDEAYRGRLVSGEYPACYLHLEIPPDQIDVNVHPQKSEVRFRDEDRVFRTIASEVKRTLDGYNQRAWQTFNTYTGNDSSTVINPVIAEAAVSLYNADGLDHEPIYHTNIDHPRAQIINHENDIMVFGQLFNSYIVATSGDSLLLIDQHAAAESLRYHELLQNQELWVPQDLLMPLSITIGKRRIEQFEYIKESLGRVGFMADTLGDETLVLRSVPTCAKGREEELFDWLLEDLFTGEIGIDEKEFFRQAVASMACHQAIKANQRLEMIEMEILVRKMIELPEAAHCPHGRPTYITIPRNRIAEWFKR